MTVAESSDVPTLADELETLRRHLEDLAEARDDDLKRYQLKRPPRPPGLYWQLRWIAGCILRWLESIYVKAPDPFPPGLKTRPGNAEAKPVVIWAVGANRETLRAACRRFADMDIASSGFAPVLVTDVADFAFFSRLGWLVEYIPALSGQGPSFRQRKAMFLARLYRHAPALPVSAADVPWAAIRDHLPSPSGHRMFDRTR